MLESGSGLDLYGLYIAGVVASRAQWRFGIFTFGFQTAIKLNQIIKMSKLVHRGRATLRHSIVPLFRYSLIFVYVIERTIQCTR